MLVYTYQNTLFGVLGCLAAVYLLILAPLYHIAHTESRYDSQRYIVWQYCRQLHTMVHFVRVQLAHSVVLRCVSACAAKARHTGTGPAAVNTSAVGARSNEHIKM